MFSDFLILSLLTYLIIGIHKGFINSNHSEKKG